MPTSNQRQNRKHQPKPASYTLGRELYALGRPPSLLTDDHLLALDCYLSTVTTLAKGGNALKRAIKDEKKKRGI
jgi:hypothetical protein